MNKYRDKSDFEINKAVAISRGLSKLDDYWEVGGKVCVDEWTFDPCNNPADAMPIILDNKIDLTHLVGDMVCAKHKEYWCIRKNPYRAGCEVYLLMKDAENEK
ncbi:phage protein NinX family protein [Morganella morganii]|uniref:phage protein NinX family protein n=1 Tax=Morganella morganii TaxID=582 RepID=UPI003EB9EE53